MERAILVKNVSVQLKKATILKDVSFDVNQGEIVAIIGPSGSGKTTLLRCLNGFVGISEGEINIGGFKLTKDLAAINANLLREKVGMVFQQYNLWPHKTALENIIEAPILLRRKRKGEAISQAKILLESMGLAGKADEYPVSLSGGQQQRVAIARSLAMEPEILLFDEVTSALDPERAWEVMQIIKNVIKEQHRTVLIVTHQIAFARDVADRIIFIDEGRIVEEGESQQLLHHPKSQRLTQFLERVTYAG